MGSQQKEPHHSSYGKENGEGKIFPGEGFFLSQGDLCRLRNGLHPHGEHLRHGGHTPEDREPPETPF